MCFVILFDKQFGFPQKKNKTDAQHQKQHHALRAIGSDKTITIIKLLSQYLIFNKSVEAYNFFFNRRFG